MAEGGFVVIKDATHEEQIPVASFTFDFVGLTDDLRLYSIQTPDQAFFTNYTNLLDGAGNPIGNTKQEAVSYLRALPVPDTIGSSVTVAANQTDYSTAANQSAILSELLAMKTELLSIKEEIRETAIDQTFTVSYSGNAIVDLGLPLGTMGEISTIAEFASGSVVFTLDGSDPNNGNSPRISGTSATFNPIKNVNLGAFKIKGTSSGSRYYITYSIYK